MKEILTYVLGRVLLGPISSTRHGEHQVPLPIWSRSTSMPLAALQYFSSIKVLFTNVRDGNLHAWNSMSKNLSQQPIGGCVRVFYNFWCSEPVASKEPSLHRLWPGRLPRRRVRDPRDPAAVAGIVNLTKSRRQRDSSKVLKGDSFQNPMEWDRPKQGSRAHSRYCTVGAVYGADLERAGA